MRLLFEGYHRVPVSYLEKVANLNMQLYDDKIITLTCFNNISISVSLTLVQLHDLTVKIVFVTDRLEDTRTDTQESMMRNVKISCFS